MSDAAVMRDGGATPPAVDAALPGAGVSIEGGALSCSAGGAGSHRPAATFPWLLGLLLGGAMRRRRAS
jgi:MYXO-CTERM domain-containing protein